MKWAGHAEHVGKLETHTEASRKRPRGIHLRTWADNIKMNSEKYNVKAWTGFKWLKITIFKCLGFSNYYFLVWEGMSSSSSSSSSVSGTLTVILGFLSTVHQFMQAVLTLHSGNVANPFRSVKVKLSLCLTKSHAMKTYGRVAVQLQALLTSVLDGGEWSASQPGRLTPRERTPGTHRIGIWVGPRTGLVVEKNKRENAKMIGKKKDMKKNENNK
jgi:hypothetical protein